MLLPPVPLPLPGGGHGGGRWILGEGVSHEAGASSTCHLLSHAVPGSESAPQWGPACRRLLPSWWCCSGLQAAVLGAQCGVGACAGWTQLCQCSLAFAERVCSDVKSNVWLAGRGTQECADKLGNDPGSFLTLILPPPPPTSPGSNCDAMASLQLLLAALLSKAEYSWGCALLSLENQAQYKASLLSFLKNGLGGLSELLTVIPSFPHARELQECWCRLLPSHCLPVSAL